MSAIKRSSLVRDDLAIGSRVVVNDLVGTVRFIGNTSFQTGKWIGVELDEPQGKNSGVVQGKRYFECKANHGVFVRPTNIKLHNEDASAGSASPSPPNSRRKSIAPTASPPPQRRKSIAAPAQPQLQQRRKSTVVPPPAVNTRRKSIVSAAPSSPVTPTNGAPTSKRRPTSLLQSSPINASPRTATNSKSTVIPNTRRKSIVPPKQSTIPNSKKTKTNTQSLPPTPVPASQSPQPGTTIKPRTPITAPSTPDNAIDEEQARLELEQIEFDNLCQQNTSVNSGMVTSPVSIETEDNVVEAENVYLDQEPEEEEAYRPQEQEQPQPVYGSLAFSRPTSKSDQTVPLKDYEELRFKLKILESKRHEDRERFREHEKVKEEAEQFLTLRNKLQDKIAELQKDVRDTKRELKETVAEKETFESKYNDLLESMEMLTLDKEVAEERAESLQQETNMLKDRIEEISVDLDILKREADILNKPPELSNAENEERTPLEVIQLERHNERLKEALLRLRDATTEQENELNYKIKTLEQENYELEEYKLQYEKTMEKLVETETLVEDLKMQLDDALGAEDLVDQLTEKNLNLTEKLDELSATVDDLEALRELADELEENHVETEKQLQAEIDHRDMLLREQLERLRANEETAADYEATIQQFRELVALLQNDLKEFRRKEESEESEKLNLSSQSQAMMSLNVQLQTTVMKAQAKAIDIELRKLEASQANDRLNMIQPYLPESFFKTENDPISCLLMFKRLEFKSALIVKHLDQNYPISEKIMDSVTENLVTICEIKQRAGWLSSLATRFQTHIKNCDPATFVTMGKVYHELIGVERRMNAIIELFRVDQINETHCLTELQRVISQVEHLVETYLQQQQEKNNSDQFFGLTKALDLNADRMIVVFTYAKQSVSNAVKNEGLVISEGLGEVDMNYHEPLGRLIALAKNSKIIAKKLMRQLEDKFEEAMTLKSEYLHRFKMLHAISTKLCTFCFDTCKEITTYLDAKRGSHEQIELSHIQTLIREKGDQIFEMVESSMWESALRTLKTLTGELETTYAQVERDDKLDKITSKVAPWIQRASDIKAEVVVNHELEHKLQQHNEEIIKLIKDVRLKDQALQESDVKISLLEKRMEMAKKEAEQIRTLEEDLEKSINQEQMYAEAMENLQHEYDALESENIQLKKEASKREEKRQSLLRKATFDLAEVEGSSDVQEMAGGYYEMAGQVETLRASIRYLRAENAQLKSVDFARTLELQPLPTVNKNEEQKEPLTDIARETRMLLKDMRVASASPRIVRLEHNQSKATTHMWQSVKKSPDYQYQTQHSVLYTLKQRSLQLRHKVDGLKDTNNNSLPKQHKISTGQPERQLPLGMIKIPRLVQDNTISNTTCTNHCIDIRSAADFKRLHTVFIH